MSIHHVYFFLEMNGNGIKRVVSDGNSKWRQLTLNINDAGECVHDCHRCRFINEIENYSPNSFSRVGIFSDPFVGNNATSTTTGTVKILY